MEFFSLRTAKSRYAGAFLILATLVFVGIPNASADPNYPISYPWSDSLKQARCDQLLKQYAELLVREPGNYPARMVYSQLTFAAWRLEKTDNRRRLKYVKMMLDNARKMVEVEPRRAEGYHWLGAAYGMAGLTRGILTVLQLVPEMKKAFEKSIELDPTYLDGSAKLQMGRAYTMLPSFPISLGDKELAFKYLREVKAQNPRFTLTYLYLADLYWHARQPEKALAELREIGKYKPQNEIEYFINAVNTDKAEELRRLISSGQERDPFYDVLSDIQPGIIE